MLGKSPFARTSAPNKLFKIQIEVRESSSPPLQDDNVQSWRFNYTTQLYALVAHVARVAHVAHEAWDMNTKNGQT